MSKLYPLFRQASVLSCVLFFLLPFVSSAQYYTLTGFRGKSLAPTSNGFYESLPYDYQTSNKSYPLLLVIHGAGDLGNGNSELDKVLELGISRRIHDGSLPISYKAGGTGPSYSFVVVMPQFFTEANGAQAINTIIDSCIKRYRILTNRIYVTGASMGGGMIWNAAGMNVTSARRIAALMPMAPHNIYNPAYGAVIASEDVPVWAFHNNNDPQVPLSQTVQWVNGINNFNPDPPVKLTVLNSNVHDAWTAATNPAYRENGMNIYEWMLTYTRNFDVLPVELEFFRAQKILSAGKTQIALTWKTSFEQDNHSFTVERSSDGINFTAITSINASGLASGSSYSYIDELPLQGISYYRLSQVDVNGTQRYFDIQSVIISPQASLKIAVYPNPASDQLGLELNSTVRGNLQARIISASGATMQTLTMNKQSELFTDKILLGTIPSGYYILEITGEGFASRVPFIKK